MRLALNEAKKALRKDEIPIGAVLVKDGKIITKGHNLTKTWRDPTAHAEIVVLREAIKTIQNERFLSTALYTTIEPCVMCAGAIVQARIPLVVFGADDVKAGACGSVLKVLPHVKLNHRPEVIKGIMGSEAARLLQSFFRKKRKRGVL